MHGGELLARRTWSGSSEPSDEEFYVKNHLGSTVALVDANGEVTSDVYDYHAYGKVVTEVTSPQRVTETFTGKEFDVYGDDGQNGGDGIGLFYFGARQYDGDIGAWTSADPAGQFWAAYAYAGNGYNPIVSVDSDGSAQVKTVPQPMFGVDGPLKNLTGTKIAHRRPVYTLSVRSVDEFVASYVSLGVPEVGMAYGLAKFIETGDPSVFASLLAGKGMSHFPKTLGDAAALTELMANIGGDLGAVGLWDNTAAIAAFKAEFRTKWYEFWKPRPEFTSARKAMSAWNRAMEKHGVEGAWIEDIGGPTTVDGQGGIVDD